MAKLSKSDIQAASPVVASVWPHIPIDLQPLSAPGIAILPEATYSHCFEPHEHHALVLKPHHGDLQAKTASGILIFIVKRKSFSWFGRRICHDAHRRPLFEVLKGSKGLYHAQTIEDRPRILFEVETSNSRKQAQTRVMVFSPITANGSKSGQQEELTFSPASKTVEGTFEHEGKTVAVIDKPKRGFFKDNEVRFQVADQFDPAIVVGVLIACQSDRKGGGASMGGISAAGGGGGGA